MKHHLTIALFILGGLLSACGKKLQETKPIRKNIVETVFASGTLEANQSYQVVAESDGILVEVNFKENDIVSTGKVLAVINNEQINIQRNSANELYNIAQKNVSNFAPQLVQAKINIDEAKQKMTYSEQYYHKLSKLLENNSIAKVEVDYAEQQWLSAKLVYKKALESFQYTKEQAEQQLLINKTEKNVNDLLTGYNKVKAIIGGKVYQKFKSKGDFVKKGDVLATLGDANIIYAKINIDETSIDKVKVGQEVIVQLNTQKNRIYKGRVAEIMPAFNDQTQSFVGKVYFNNPPNFTIINTQIQANIITGTTANALLIPRVYLQYGNLVNVKGTDHPVKVTTKIVGNNWVQVLAGLNENTTIVTNKTN